MQEACFSTSVFRLTELTLTPHPSLKSLGKPLYKRAEGQWGVGLTLHSPLPHPSLITIGSSALTGWALYLFSNLINANSQSEPDGLPVRSLRTQSSLTTVRVWRCNRSLRNNDEQEAACPLASFPFLVSSQWLLFDWLVLLAKDMSEGSVRGQWRVKSTPHWLSVPFYKGILRDLSEGWGVVKR